MGPGMVEGLKIAYGTPGDVEYVYAIPPTIAVRTPLVMAYMGEAVQSFEIVPLADMYTEPDWRFWFSLDRRTINTNDDSSKPPVGVAEVYALDDEVAFSGDVRLAVDARGSVHCNVVMPSKLVGALLTVMATWGMG